MFETTERKLKIELEMLEIVYHVWCTMLNAAWFSLPLLHTLLQNLELQSKQKPTFEKFWEIKWCGKGYLKTVVSITKMFFLNESKCPLSWVEEITDFSEIPSIFWWNCSIIIPCLIGTMYIKWFWGWHLRFSYGATWDIQIFSVWRLEKKFGFILVNQKKQTFTLKKIWVDATQNNLRWHPPNHFSGCSLNKLVWMGSYFDP